MHKIVKRAGIAGALSASLFLAPVVGPVAMAEGPASSAVSVEFEAPPIIDKTAEGWANIPAPVADETTLADFNPVAVQEAEAAWWHIAVRKWGKVCGHVWLGGDRYEVKKQAYGYTSSKPTCQRTGKTVILRNFR